ncbi:hypothetical protein [Fischerella sp. PCC 9605]|uniref:hypothetical protein n=1 Tax=Fischerella sp. PCC 9605 TaxID=1173024 RepID=UPI00047D0363|nr:hypothetical protein [Fischerella sp. PCC 9605]
MTNQQPPNNRLDSIEAILASHNQILNELAIAHQQLASFSTRQAERQQQQLDRHDEALTRIEEQQQRTAAQAERTERTMQALSQTQVECLQLIAQNTVAIARSDQRIQEILERLDRRFGNGNGRGEG